MNASVITTLIRAVVVSVLVSGCGSEKEVPPIGGKVTESPDAQDRAAQSSSATTDLACASHEAGGRESAPLFS